VFGGLFPEPYNKQILKLLFTLAHWHALAKLRQHTDLSLDLLEATTALLGKAFGEFEEKTCPAFETQELRREAEARQRRQANALSSAAPATSAANKHVGRRQKKFNRRTYKNHSLGDYVRAIRTLGTTDSYSTEGVCIHFALFKNDSHILDAKSSPNWSTEPRSLAMLEPVAKVLRNNLERLNACRLVFAASANE
jgi:hypothetical protein